MALSFCCRAQTVATDITVHNPYSMGSQKMDENHLFCAEGELVSCELYQEDILTNIE